jgi:hypothetical protein
MYRPFFSPKERALSGGKSTRNVHANSGRALSKLGRERFNNISAVERVYVLYFMYKV